MINKKKSLISNKMNFIPEALSIKINQSVYELKRKKKDIITLSLGEAFFNLPNLNFKGVDINSGYHYSDSQGIPILRQKISNYYKDEFKTKVNPNNIIISCGSKPLIYMCMLCLGNPGDKILIQEPGWLSYVDQAKLANLKVGYIPYNVNPSNIEKYFDKNVKMLVLSNPNNPSGKLYSKSELTTISNQCYKNNIYLLVDEAYSDFAVNDFFSLLRLKKTKTRNIVVNSLSKNLSISGWRIGYSIVPDDMVAHMIKLNQHLITCAPTLLSNYVAQNFKKLLNHTKPQIKKIKVKRNNIINFVKKLELKLMEGSSTFYFFLDVSDYSGSTKKLANELLYNNNISVVPGEAYGSSTEKFIRISIGTESEVRIKKALVTIKEKLNLTHY